MEKQVDDKGGASAAAYEEHHNGHSGDHKEDKHHNKEHTDEVVDSEVNEKSTPRETHDDGKKGAVHQSQGTPWLHENHASNDKDARVTHGLDDNLDTLVKRTHGNEDAGMMQEPAGTSATHGKHEHNVEHAFLAHETPENPSMYGKHTPHHDKDADMTHESIEKPAMHGKIPHDNEVTAVTCERMEKSATQEKATHDHEHAGLAHESGERRKMHEKSTHDDEHVGLVHESGERDEKHGKHTDGQDVKSLMETAKRPTTHEKLTHVETDMDSTSKSKESQGKQMQDDEAGHASHASEKQLPVDGEHISDVEYVNMYHTPGDKSPRHEKRVHDGDDAGVAHEHGHKHRCNVLHGGTSQEHGEKYRSVDDECESKKAFSDDNSSRERVQFSRGSTPDVDTPTQCTSSPFSNTKPSKAGSKGVGNAERGPGSTDGNLETPPTSWAFSARASIAPSKFDHMATLRITYAAYKENKQGKEGVPLSLT